jgi:hypothetical protein
VGHSRRRSSSNVTINHDEIRQWVESRGGKPATVKSTTTKGQAAGMLRIDFPGYSGARSLKAVSWDDWFEIFEQGRLALLYQDRTMDGRQSRFNKLVSRD